MTHFSKSPIRRLTCLILAILLTVGVFAVSATAEQSVTVEPIAFRNPDFVRGMDVSSVITLEKSGVIFRNRDGDREDIFKILADNGVNTIRARVWNDPYDSRDRREDRSARGKVRTEPAGRLPLFRLLG